MSWIKLKSALVTKTKNKELLRLGEAELRTWNFDDEGLDLEIYGLMNLSTTNIVCLAWSTSCRVIFRDRNYMVGNAFREL